VNEPLRDEAERKARPQTDTASTTAASDRATASQPAFDQVAMIQLCGGQLVVMPAASARGL
jgi:hypothetical protein